MRIKAISPNHEWYDDVEWVLQEFHAGKIDSIECLRQLRSLGMEDAYVDPYRHKGLDWKPSVIQGGLPGVRGE